MFDCLYQGATCGTGILKRTINCVTKPGGVVVHQDKCQVGSVKRGGGAGGCYISLGA